MWADVGVSLPLIGVPVLGPGHHQAAETSGSPGWSGCIRPSCWCCCPFPRGAAERSCGGGGDTCLCLMRAGTFTKGLWATCCLPLSTEEAAGGSCSGVGDPARVLPCLRVPHLPPGEGAVLFGARGIGEGHSWTGQRPVAACWFAWDGCGQHLQCGPL